VDYKQTYTFAKGERVEIGDHYTGGIGISGSRP
jgi:hypothetical protein